MEISTLLVFFAGILAGFIDAAAGGGGLIMIPTLIMSGLPAGTAIATNKLCGTSGTLTSSFRFAWDGNVNWGACFYMGIPAVFGSILGSRSIGILPQTWVELIVLLLLVMITIFVILQPDFGIQSSQKDNSNTLQISNIQIIKLFILGLIIGFHDGFFGPGAGTFFVFGLLSVCSIDFLKGTGSSKVINFMTNITALTSFLFLGLIDFPKGIIGAVGVILGSYHGATFATKQGVRVIRPLFISVSFVLIAKLLIDYL